MADIDPALMEKVFDIPKRQRKPDIHHHRKLDDLGRRLEVAERIAGHHVTLAFLRYRLNRPALLTIPSNAPHKHVTIGRFPGPFADFSLLMVSVQFLHVRA